MDEPKKKHMDDWLDAMRFAAGIRMVGSFDIRKVVFHNPATIVYWVDGTKTVVKAGKDDTFDPEKGLAMAFAKKALGNTGRYYNTFKQLIKNCMKEEE